VAGEIEYNCKSYSRRNEREWT